MSLLPINCKIYNSHYADDSSCELRQRRTKYKVLALDYSYRATHREKVMGSRGSFDNPARKGREIVRTCSSFVAALRYGRWKTRPWVDLRGTVQVHRALSLRIWWCKVNAKEDPLVRLDEGAASLRASRGRAEHTQRERERERERQREDAARFSERKVAPFDGQL